MAKTSLGRALMELNFKPSLVAVLNSEGGNDDDRADHGGRTSRGITQREYNAWCAENHKPTVDVWKAQQTQIEAIYHEEYWQPFCDAMPIGIDYIYFDMAVNAGPHRAAMLLQQSLGVNADGRIGAMTRQAIKSADSRRIIERYTNAKAAFYTSLHQPRFLRGWLNRDRDVRATALAMLST